MGGKRAPVKVYIPSCMWVMGNMEYCGKPTKSRVVNHYHKYDRFCDSHKESYEKLSKWMANGFPE